MIGIRGSGKCLLTVVASAMLVPAPGRAADWPRWLGPTQDGRTTGLAERAGEQVGLKLAWKRKLGIGYSGIAIAGSRALTMFGDGKRDWLVALDARTGDEIWRYDIGETYPSLGGSEGGPAGMPVVDNGVVFALAAAGELFAVSLADGKQLWRQNVAETLGARKPSFGFSTVPLVSGSVVFLAAGGDAGRALVGLDRETGKKLWSFAEDRVGYQSPIAAELAGRSLILAVTDRAVFALDPRTGERLWEHAHGIESDEGAGTPVLLGGDRFLLTANGESKAFRVVREANGWRVEEAWRSTDLKRSFATPVVHGEHVYGFDADFLTAVSAETGQKVWKSRPPGGRGLILVDGRLIVLSNDGAIVVIDASPDGYEEQARLPVTSSGTYTYPSFAGGRIFVRNTTEIAAVDVVPGAEVDAAKAAPARPAPANAFERFVREVEGSSAKALLIDEFLRRQASFPILEDDRFVHFVYRGDVEDVAISGSMTEFQVEEPLSRIPETELFYRSYPIEHPMRWEYQFNVGFAALAPDPHNPRRVPGREGDGSEVATSDWVRDPLFQPYTGGAPGRIERFKLASAAVGNEREVAVWLPHGYDRGAERFPLAVFLDGGAWLDEGRMENALNQIVGETSAPLIAAFVRSPESEPMELFGERGDDLVRMLADELVPRLDASFRTTARSESRAVVGIGSGAAHAVYAALTRPEIFGRSGVTSPYLGVPTAKKLFALLEPGAKRGDSARSRFHVTWHVADTRRADWNVDVARDGRRLAELLEARELPVDSAEVRDSGGWGAWPVRAREILAAFFPAGTRSGRSGTR